MKKAFFYFVCICFTFVPLSCKKNMDYLVTISTEFGNIDLILYDETPKHKENFLKLANEKFYDGTAFHRVIDNFMVQGGDPNSKNSDPNTWGTGDPGYTIPAEIVAGLNHKKGAVAAARKGDGVNPQRASSGSQFYIVENETGTPHLDGQYSVFGQVLNGFDVVAKIAEQPKNKMDRPLKDIRMTVSVKKMSKKEITQQYGYQYKEEK